MNDEWENVLLNNQDRRKHYPKKYIHVHSLVDMKPKETSVTRTLGMNRIRRDCSRASQLFLENMKLTRRLLDAQASVRSFDPRPSSPSKINNERSQHLLNQLDRENYKFGCKLLSIKSSDIIQRSVMHVRKKKKPKDPLVPEKLLAKYSYCIQPRNDKLLKYLLRPKIFFDLYMQGIRPMGRLVLELYTEACPELVLEFVRVCTHKSADKISFIRTYPLLWIEGEIKTDNLILSKPDIMHETHAIDQGERPGVMSFANCYLNGFPPGLLNFTISFKPLTVVRGHRVPFGLVTKGLKLLNILKDVGTKHGVMKKKILVTNCGYL